MISFSASRQVSSIYFGQVIMLKIDLFEEEKKTCCLLDRLLNW